MQFTRWILPVILICLLLGCNQSTQEKQNRVNLREKELFEKKKPIIPGAHRTKAYFPLIREYNVAVLVNHTSLIEGTHLIDSLLHMDFKLQKIFTPEHGFEGTADAGAHVENTTYKDSDIEVVSLYGSKKKPSDEDMQGIDLLIYDIQDVGVRFYTYISTMHYAMEACAQNNVKFMVLDRPNPNGDYVDGPVLDTANFQSFVGMHPVPVVYGMSPGEYATMINNEGWLSGGGRCVLSIVKMKNYRHSRKYELPVKPSPNLPNYRAVRLYPSLCFFEATPLSVGRGTDFPFQIVGYPNPAYGDFTFTPQPREGASVPKLNGRKCYGVDLRNTAVPGKLELKYVLNFYNQWEEDKPFFSRERWFNLLAGNDTLIEKIRQGKTAAEIRNSWKKELQAFKRTREKYLLYLD